jgi:hypothetical protein
MDPRVLATIVGGVVIGALVVAAGATVLRLKWPRAAMDSGLIQVVFVAGAIGYVVKGVLILRELQSNVRHEIEEMPAPGPAAFRCVRCGDQYPSRYYFDEALEEVCLNCSRGVASNAPVKRDSREPGI